MLLRIRYITVYFLKRIHTEKKVDRIIFTFKSHKYYSGHDQKDNILILFIFYRRATHYKILSLYGTFWVLRKFLFLMLAFQDPLLCSTILQKLEACMQIRSRSKWDYIYFHFRNLKKFFMAIHVFEQDFSAAHIPEIAKWPLSPQQNVSPLIILISSIWSFEPECCWVTFSKSLERFLRL